MLSDLLIRTRGQYEKGVRACGIAWGRPAHTLHFSVLTRSPAVISATLGARPCSTARVIHAGMGSRWTRDGLQQRELVVGNRKSHAAGREGRVHGGSMRRRSIQRVRGMITQAIVEGSGDVYATGQPETPGRGRHASPLKRGRSYNPAPNIHPPKVTSGCPTFRVMREQLSRIACDNGHWSAGSNKSVIDSVPQYYSVITHPHPV